MRPVAFSFGPVVVYSYLMLFVFALLAAWAAARFAGRRAGLPGHVVTDLVLVAALGGVVGARAWHVLAFRDAYAGHVFRFFELQTGGLVFYGGLVGGALAVFAYARLTHTPIAPVMGVAAVAVPVGSAIGRIGCLAEGCCGGPGLAIGSLRIPPQTVDSLVEIALFGALVAILLSRPSSPSLTLWAYLTLYPVLRFGLEWLRADIPVAFGLTQAQIASIAVLPVGLAGLAVTLGGRGDQR